MTEPGAGSDLASMRTTARRDGDGWVLNGSKTFITNGTAADLVVVAARTGSGPREITLFAIEEGVAGSPAVASCDKVGQPEADTAELFFEDVRLGDEQSSASSTAASPHDAPPAPGAAAQACANIAHAAGALEQTLEYAKERQAFGRPIGTFQHSRFLLAELVTESSDADLHRPLRGRVRRGRPARHRRGEGEVVERARPEPRDRRVRAALRRLRLHGRVPVARAWADARVTKIWAGSNEIMKEVIGRSLGLGQARGVS